MAVLCRFPPSTTLLSFSSTLSIFTNEQAQQVIARQVCECLQGIIEYPQRGQIRGAYIENKQRTKDRKSQPAISRAA